MEFQEAKAIAERLGFQLFADVRGDTNALRLLLHGRHGHERRDRRA